MTIADPSKLTSAPEPGRLESLEKGIPLGHGGTPAEPAAAVYLLHQRPDGGVQRWLHVLTAPSTVS